MAFNLGEKRLRGFRKMWAALRRGDYNTAAAEMLGQIAEAGDPDAQYRLGMMYDFGQGVKKDPTESARWLRLAAVQGLPEAQFLRPRHSRLTSRITSLRSWAQ